MKEDRDREQRLLGAWWNAYSLMVYLLTNILGVILGDNTQNHPTNNRCQVSRRSFSAYCVLFYFIGHGIGYKELVLDNVDPIYDTVG